MILKQMKHSEKNKEETIPWVAVNDWFEDCQKKMNALRYNTCYEIVYLFITNWRITSMPQTLPIGLAVVSYENLANYFGETVALLAQLTALK
jgi:hypothetical protein